MVRLICLFLAGICLVPAATVQGDIYKYVDKDGVVHFTNTPVSTEYVLYMRENDRFRDQSADPDAYDHLIRSAADRFKVPFPLIKAVIRVESAFNPKAVSSKGARGLMQIMPQNFSSLSLNDPFDPSQNIMAGTSYLKQLLDRYRQQVRLALAAYNAGPDAVDRYQQIPPFSETQEYVRKVMILFNQFKGA
ncbi:MAG: lytic transglycosylase domain-containing protein [Desulfotignum sp.]|nr:lytic transglycosylase domain-containing protein [Desulfotignum sp.]